MTFECPAPIRALLDSLDVPLEALERRALVHCPEARVLEIAEVGADGREHRLAPEAAAAWRRMRDAAAADGEQMHIVSAFRSVERQAQIVRAKLDKGLPLEAILEVSAAPGFSEPHTGLAVDLGTPGQEPLTEAFEDTAAFRWLTAHAGTHGFRLSYPRGNSQGYAYEPWHWRYHAEDTSSAKAI
jgi:D-alanyl-D-alanine carboxypeptidase